jgi:hypothetical protein
VGNVEIGKEIVTGVFAVLVVILPIILTYRFSEKKKKKKEEALATSHVKLKHHPVFARLKAYQSYIKTGFFLENKGKQEVFRNLLLNEIQIRHDLLMELAEEIEQCMSHCLVEGEDECNKLYNRNLECLRNGVEALNRYYKTSDYTADEQRVLDTVMAKFNKWYEPRIKRLEETIPLICGSRFYADCYTRQAVIFDMYLGTIADMISDAEKTISEINGDLRGMVFRGITI